jgi:hypothetical protein
VLKASPRLFVVSIVLCAFVSISAQPRQAGWPPVTRETKPWTRWWWMGSAVDPAGLSAELESLKAGGLGGVEITPIYGVAGAESKFVPYLSQQWTRLLEHTLREASRLGVGVDMATGTGWPFGGPWVGEIDAARGLTHRTWTIEAGQTIREPIAFDQPAFVRAIGFSAGGATSTQQAPRKLQIGDLVQPLGANPNLQGLALEQIRFPKPLPLISLVAYSKTGAIVDLTSRVSARGALDWTAPAGSWTLYGVFLGWHGKLVERAAPGGEGNVIDHFSHGAIGHYLDRFDSAFAGHSLTGLRAFFNDSYEVDDAQGESDGTATIFDEFQKRRGYDLRQHLPALFGDDKGATSDRVLADYRLTISDLLRDTFTADWRAWAKRRGAIVRNQAHGSPANLLDLYGASDIPETEGTEITRARWATSAAHVAGRRLVSAEAATWLDEHFRAKLSDVRAAVDRFFISGVNHIVYHGTAYSPPNDPWPGWQFYASVEFNPRNTWWRDFAALNDYVTRTQSFLQSGSPDQDVLLYFPFYESAAMRGTQGLLKHFGGASPPPEGTMFEQAHEVLQQRGYSFDFISDAQLQSVRRVGRRLITGGGGSYSTLVVPRCKYMPLETLAKILDFARSGATILLLGGFPDDVSGLADFESRTARFQKLRDSVQFGSKDADGVVTASFGSGRILQGSDLEPLVLRAGAIREPLVDSGLQFVRRRYSSGRAYFILNPGDRQLEAWTPLASRNRHAVLFDPSTGQYGGATERHSATGALEIHLMLPPAASIIVQTTDVASGSRFPSVTDTGPAIPVNGPWKLRFTAGGPTLPAERTIERLGSWTSDAGEDVKTFAGTAEYSTTFPRPPGNADAWLLDLGRVHESARVRLNDREIGVLLGPTFRLTIDAKSLAATNTLEIEVTNLAANRIAALDRAGVPWKKFYNVNFPPRFPESRGPDGLFSAAKWDPADSGLVGPVTMTALSRF